MCGIFGSLGPESNLLIEKVVLLHQALTHRGPDDQGFTTGQKFALGFNRLAILDLSASGHQPMYDTTGRYCLVFNGEIFNYLELKNTYLPGIALRGTSDSEVLLELLILKKEKALPLLNGMFAFCFLDTKTGDYVLARDRFGIKPLYFTFQKNTLFFASELKALRQLTELYWAVDQEALFSYLGNGYITEDRSIFERCHKLLPASFIKGNIHQLNFSENPVSYWVLSHEDAYANSYQDAIAEFETIFANAVDIRLRSDVPLGIFLSGGIDSGLVAAFAAKQQEITCYTVGFTEKKYDEANLAEKTARHICANWKCIHLNEMGISQIGELAGYYDEPFADSSALPSFEICRAGAREATVFLTGDAGDEAFAGYNRYIKRLKNDTFHNLTRPLGVLSSMTSIIPLSHKIKFHKITSEPSLRDAYYDEIPGNPWQVDLIHQEYHEKFRQIFRNRVRAATKYTNPTINQQSFDYRHYLPDDILVKMDRASMAHSIEVRSPFLDFRLHEFAAKLPRKWLIDRKSGKKLLRDVAKKYLPAEVVNAKKRGFGIPVNEWTRNEQFLAGLRENAKYSELFQQYIQEDALHRLIERHRQKKLNVGSMMWRLAMLLAWEQRYMN